MTRRWFGTLTLLVICLAGMLAYGQEPAGGTPKATPSSASGLTTGGIPASPVGLAKYFQDLALQEQALAESYKRIAKMYEQKMPPSDVDPASARELKNHYRRLAETQRKTAETAARVATYHTRLALLVQQLPAQAAAAQASPQDSARIFRER